MPGKKEREIDVIYAWGEEEREPLLQGKEKGKGVLVSPRKSTCGSARFRLSLSPIF